MLAPLRSSEDGTHQVTIGLEPEGLGTVKATVTVNGSQIVVQLGADSDQARDALRQALPLLKHELSGDGSSANVVLTNGDSDGRPTFAGPSTSSSGPSDDDVDDGDGAGPTPSAVSVPSPAGHIDLHL
jgi:flagellar hook-length control protein FliK